MFSFPHPPRYIGEYNLCINNQLENRFNGFRILVTQKVLYDHPFSNVFKKSKIAK